MDSIRIAILSANNTPVAFMDNAHKKSMHYWDDELHEYLQGAANTYTFTVNAKHPDAEHVTVGNKVAFTYKGRSYYLNIVNTDQTEKTITATAWSLSFELINEDAGEYKAGKAMSFEEYLAVFDAERTLKLGLNEVSDKRITNEWTGTTTVLKRLFSLANVFSAEIEFETVLNSDYSLKEIVLNVYREHSDTDSGIGEYRSDVVLRYGKGITGIRKTTDAEKLYTCIQPTGKDGLTINGLDKKEYDENGNIEYFTDGALIRAPQARDRFPSNIVNKADAYILMRKEYDTDSKDKLYSMALSDLKTASEPVVTYEVDGYFDTNIGDTVRMQDQEWTPVLYLQARVSEQIRSLTNPKTAKTVFTNYKELTSEISDSLLQRMQDLINKNKVYTCSISTNNGVIFKNGIGSTTLTAYAYDNGVDVADKLQFRWSKDGHEFYVGKSVTVNATDVDTKAVYSFEAMENGIKRGYYEVTITGVMDGEDGKDGTNSRSYILEASDTAIKKGADGALTPSKITFRSFYRDGDSATRIPYNGRFKIEESTNGTSYSVKYTSSANESAKEYTPTATAKILRCTLYGAGGTINALDTQSVVVLTDVDNLKIGGRNILKNSKNGIVCTRTDHSSTTTPGATITTKATGKGSAYGWIEGFYTTPVTELSKRVGTEFAFSLDVKITGSFTNLRTKVDFRDTSHNSSIFSNFIGINGLKVGKWTRVSGVASVKEVANVTATRSLFLFDWSNSTVGSTIEYRNLQLEEGNKSTAWTPAPEDIETLVVTLSNDSQTVATDTNGNGGNFIDCSTKVQVYNGAQDVSKVATYTVTKSSGIAGTWDLSTRTYKVSALSTDNGWVDIKVTYNGNSITRRFTVSKSKQGAQGATGPQGVTGNGIKSITNYYLATASGSGVSASTSGWTTTVQAITASKKYLWNYEVVTYTNGSTYQSAPCIIGAYGDKGATGATGATGPSGIIVSSTAPSNPKVGQLWQTASGQPIKRWDGSRWVIHYISVDNLNAQTLSAIAADLGTVTAGLIKDKNGTMLIDVTSGKIISKKIVQGAVENVASLSNAYLAFSGKALATDRATMSVNLQNIMFTNENTRKATTIQFEDEMIYARNSVSPRISIYAYRNYDSGTVKGPYTSTNSANNIRVELKRRGCMVTCKITMIAQFPGSGEYGVFNEVKIPVGYRPVMDFFAPYSEVSGPNIFGTGRYGIGKDGGIKIYVENAAWTERHATFTWITDD